MSSSSSQFYPPRARGLGRLRGVSFALRRIFYASPVQISAGYVSAISAAVVPGYVLRMIGYPILSTIAMSAYAIALMIFAIALGYPSANYAFAFMLSLHAVSALLAFRRFVPTEAFEQRLVTSVGILAILIFAYVGGQSLVGIAITPLSYNGNVYIVNGLVSAKRVKRGERIAYRIDQTYGAAIVEAGFGFGNILAVGGDKIEFTKESVLINGVSFPRQGRMPEAGELVVPENHWFIWPEFAINMRGAAAEIQARQMLLRMGMVPKEDFAGRIFGHWFWRKQL